MYSKEHSRKEFQRFFIHKQQQMNSYTKELKKIDNKQHNKPQHNILHTIAHNTNIHSLKQYLSQAPSVLNRLAIMSLHFWYTQSISFVSSLLCCLSN